MKRVFILLAMLVVGGCATNQSENEVVIPSNSQSSPSEPSGSVEDIQTEFFEGEVMFLSGGWEYSKFKIPTTNVVIQVKNDTHIRFKSESTDPLRLKILAPMTVVEELAGSIPNDYIKQYTLGYYLNFRDQYEGKTEAEDSSQLQPPFSAEDIEYIFSLSHQQWEEDFLPTMASLYRDQFIVQTLNAGDGTGINARTEDGQFGISIQPFFNSPSAPLDMMFFSMMFPESSNFAQITDNDLENLELFYRENAGDTNFSIHKIVRESWVIIQWRFYRDGLFNN